MKTTEILTLKNFLDSELKDFAVYKTMQQLPHFIDGLSQTQRKTLWVLSNHANQKVKIADIYSLIYKETKYLHGDLSAKNVANNLAAPWNNNINLIESRANFGSRTNKSAAAARYASTKYAAVSKLLFPEIDKNIRDKEFMEGQEIEPKYLNAVLPIALINGFSGIAMGYSASIVARDPYEIAKLIKDLLAGKRKTIPKNLKPWLPHFKGNIEYGDNDKQFVFTGILNKIKSTKKYGTIVIDELPPKYQRESYVELLDKLVEKGHIVSWKDRCQKNDFYFEIKAPIETYNKSDKELYNLFSLVQKQSETLTFLMYTKDTKEIREYKSVSEYLADWIKERIKGYVARKQFILDDLKSKIKLASEKARFIQDVINQKIIIQKRKKKDIEAGLEKAKYLKIDDKYDYLLSMPLWNLTQEKIDELNNLVVKLKNQYTEIDKKEPREFWLDDIKLLLPVFKKELKSKTKA